jgi:bifunctional oligoribonuclease and PAP phosphatase NrnA
MAYPETSKIKELVEAGQNIVIIQADNPDADSLASSLALEEILGGLGKQAHLYCGVDIPDYLKHIKGWDRVVKEIPNQFDLSIIVDTGALVLLEKLEQSEFRPWVAAKPAIVLDHHAGVKCDIPYATAVINDDDAVACGEVIYKLAKDLGWPLNLDTKTHVASAILSDSLGLTSEGTTANTYRIMADLIEGGVDRPALEEARRELSKMHPDIFRYKSVLIERTEFHTDGKIALAVVTPDEIKRYSPLYNPAPLIQADTLQTEGVLVAVVLKRYDDGKVTGSVRCNPGGTIAAGLAEHFGGGGHAYASGFKIQDGRSFDEIKSETIKKATELLNNIKK